MTNVREHRRRLHIIAALLILVNVIAASMLVYSLMRSGQSRQSEFAALRVQVQRQKMIVVPPNTVQQRVEEARKQIDDFYRSRVPGQFSDVYDRLGKVAAQNRVKLANIRYNEGESDIPGLHRINIQASLGGDYAQVLKFINALERDKMFFIIDSVSLGEQQGGAVRLEIALEAYLRSNVAL